MCMFLKLKQILTLEPVLKSPQFNGKRFMVTTDGCKDRFAAVLAQRFTTTLPGGKVVKRIHPVGFTSKRTSQTEEKYKPFLLEFAALKFGLDKFSDLIWGAPIEIETDCQAYETCYLMTRSMLHMPGGKTALQHTT
jgi:hypothetical protein